MDYTVAEVLLSEVLGTAILLLLGAGVVATAILPASKGNGGGWLLINFGWGIAVFAGVYVAFKSGAYLNPAVVLGVWASGADTFNSTMDANFVNFLLLSAAELVGAFLGAVGAWLAFKKHFDLEAAPGTKLGVFATGPAVRSYGWNLVTEIAGTFVLVFVLLTFAKNPAQMGPLPVALLIVGIGASLGGPTGYAINPARDLGPRIAHALLPIPDKGDSDWSYSWVPIVGPLIGGALGGLLAMAYVV
ncbi:MIP/aquaporin family protein [Cellulomonas soli]